MASQSNSEFWMGAASSDISMPSNPVLNLEGESSWKAPTASESTRSMDVVKDNGGTSSFSENMLDEEWQASLRELSYSSPYGNLSDPRSSFGSLLESPVNVFDTTNNLSSRFPSAPLTLGVRGLESNRVLEDLAYTGQGSSVGLLSSISPGGQLRSNPMDSFSSGLASSFNHGIISTGGSLSNMITPGSSMNHTVRTSNFPRMTTPSFSDAYPTAGSALNQSKTGKDGFGGPRNEFVPYHSNNRTLESQSYLQAGQQTLFQKRAASRRGGTSSRARKSPPGVVTSGSNNSSADTPGKDHQSPHLQKAHLQNASGSRVDINSGSDDPNDMVLDGDDDDVRDDDDLDESGDGSGGPCEVEEGAGDGSAENNGKGNGKGKRGLPAKNLMAERRRRKKLNDRLLVLRSIVPKITKMDRASILVDAIDYVKELQQSISDMEKELEASTIHESPPMTSSPTPRCFPAAAKEECPILPNPESQPPRVEVREREGRALNIHMFCPRRPELLLSTVRALDDLGLDVQQAVISCFNGFAMDIFRAEAMYTEVGPEAIRAALLSTAAGFPPHAFPAVDLAEQRDELRNIILPTQKKKS